MSDEIQNGQDIEVKDKTQVEVPTTETKPEGELPESASERTRQEFEKLKQRNKELAEKLAQREQLETNSLLDTLTGSEQQIVAQSNLPQGQVEDIVKNLTDENGYIDEALLKKTLQDATLTATQAVQAAQQAQFVAKKAEERVSKYEQNENIKKAYAEFPQSNPESDDYDPQFMELVRNEMIGQAMNRIQPSFYDACKKWSSVAKQPTAKVGQVAEKEQINAESNSTKPVVNNEKLVEKTRKGDQDSIAARLAAIGL